MTVGEGRRLTGVYGKNKRADIIVNALSEYRDLFTRGQNLKHKRQLEKETTKHKTKDTSEGGMVQGSLPHSQGRGEQGRNHSLPYYNINNSFVQE